MIKTRTGAVKRLVSSALAVTTLSFIGCGTTIGPLQVSSDTTLTAGVLGQIEITGDNLTLDCQNHPIVYDGAAPNCGAAGTETCGIRIASRSNVRVYNCEVYYFDLGVWISSSTDISVEDSLASGNGVGYYTEASSRVDFVQSTAMENTEEGFATRLTTDAFYWESATFQNGRDGFDENDGSSAYYLRNDSIDNGLNGFEIDFGPGVTYWENWAFVNGQHGISLDAIDGALVKANEIDAPGDDGLRLDDQNNVGTTNSVVEDNYSEPGIGVSCHQCGNLCTGNTFANNIFVLPVNNCP